MKYTDEKVKSIDLPTTTQHLLIYPLQLQTSQLPHRLLHEGLKVVHGTSH